MRPIIRSGLIPIALLLAAGCGDGATAPPRQPATEYEAQRGADLSRAKELYRAGKDAEGAAILRELASHEDWNVRSRAIVAIGDVRDAGLLPVLHRALSDSNLEVRESTSRVLQWMGDSTSLEPLRKALRDPEGIIRSHAAEALARIGGASQLQALEQVLRNDEDPTVRALTASALGQIGDPAVVPPLVAALDDASVPVRSRAAEALGEAGFASAREALEKAASGDPDEGVRSTAAAALRRLSEKKQP